MLLRRITQHVHDQNWFAVWIDLIVVVVGIFLGLQVTEWANDRQDRVTEWHYLNRLLDNTTINQRELEQALEVHRALEQSHIQTIQVLSQSSLSQQDRQFLSMHLPRVLFWRAIDLNTGLIDSLLSSGEWKIIQNSPLLEQLLIVQSDAASLKRQIDYFRSWATGYVRDIGYQTQFSVSLDTQSGVDGTTAYGVEQTSRRFLIEAPDERLLNGKSKSMVSTMLFPRRNLIGSLNDHLEIVRELRRILLAELQTRWPDRPRVPATRLPAGGKPLADN